MARLAAGLSYSVHPLVVPCRARTRCPDTHDQESEKTDDFHDGSRLDADGLDDILNTHRLLGSGTSFTASPRDTRGITH
jgi:hypothetical protein